MNDVRHNGVIDFGCICFRILWAKFRFSSIKVCGVVVDGPAEGVAEEGKSFRMIWTWFWIEQVMGIGCVC